MFADFDVVRDVGPRGADRTHQVALHVHAKCAFMPLLQTLCGFGASPNSALSPRSWSTVRRGGRWVASTMAVGHGIYPRTRRLIAGHARSEDPPAGTPAIDSNNECQRIQASSSLSRSIVRLAGFPTQFGHWAIRAPDPSTLQPHSGNQLRVWDRPILQFAPQAKPSFTLGNPRPGLSRGQISRKCQWLISKTLLLPLR